MRIIKDENEQSILQEIGARIRQYRIAMNLTQAKLADKCGISVSTVARIENGIDSKFSHYIRILRTFGLIENIDLLIIEAQPDYKALYEQKPARQKVKSKSVKQKSNWVWGEDK